MLFFRYLHVIRYIFNAENASDIKLAYDIKTNHYPEKNHLLSTRILKEKKKKNDHEMNYTRNLFSKSKRSIK
jgi:hypothetical protein